MGDVASTWGCASLLCVCRRHRRGRGTTRVGTVWLKVSNGARNTTKSRRGTTCHVRVGRPCDGASSTEWVALRRVHREAGSEEDPVEIVGPTSCVSSDDASSPDGCTHDALSESTFKKDITPTRTHPVDARLRDRRPFTGDRGTRPMMPLYHVALERDRLDAAPKLRVLQNVIGRQFLQRYTLGFEDNSVVARASCEQNAGCQIRVVVLKA
jgi:hypothetical protein